MKLFKQGFGKRQLIGMAIITAATMILFVARVLIERTVPSYAQNHVTVSGYDGGGRRGMFILWLLLVMAFSLVNLGIAAAKRLKK